MNSRADSTGPLSLATLRAIVGQASDGIFITDHTLRIEWVNERACALLDFPREDLIGKRIDDLLDATALVDEPLRRADLVAGRPTMTLRRFRTATGEMRTLEVSATAIGEGRLLGIARDATERLRAQDRLTRSEASFRAMIEASPDGVVVHRAGQIVYMNPAGARILGAPSPDVFVGTSLMDLVHPEDRPLVVERMLAMRRGEPLVPFADERLIRPDGSCLTASVSAMMVLFEGEPAIVVVARDVTAERHWQEQLAQADRMASLGTLAAGVAHEINNPLSYVLLHLDSILRLAERTDATDAGAFAEHAAMASEGAHRVARIVRDLRAFSRFDNDVRAPTDVRDAIDLAVSTASHELKHRAKLSLSFADVPQVRASEGRLAQIFLNLLLNAAHAIPEGHPENNEICIATTHDPQRGEIFVSVRDTGVGIGEDDQRRLFEPFFTTKPVGEGSGLGLAICHGLVTGLGGRILVESAKGKGSTFTVVLPEAPEQRSSQPPKAPLPVGLPSRARLLIVDDEPAICEAIAGAFAGMREFVAATSADAAQEILEHDDAFDAIVCDLLMPERSGADLYRWIVERKPALAARTVFMSGGRAEDARRALGLPDHTRLIAKPFDRVDFEAIVSRAMRATNSG